MTVFVCVKWGYQPYSADYVTRLEAGIRRNLRRPARFICFTDDASALPARIEHQSLPGQGVVGWWNKLYLFASSAPRWAEDDERIVYIDLDTIIVANIDHLVKDKLAQPFAALRDFYRPSGLGSGVMIWSYGFGHQLWDAWLTAGKPMLDGGDQAWIERWTPKFLRLQDAFPDCFVSFKVDCRNGPPPAASVVCFHGRPKPHDCLSKAWVRRHWLGERA